LLSFSILSEADTVAKMDESSTSAVNLTDLVTGGIKSGDKAKVRKPRKGGRTPVDKEPATAVHEREPLVEDSSFYNNMPKNVNNSNNKVRH
jgi:hypothetical protein